jgi:hypothetical protein
LSEKERTKGMEEEVWSKVREEDERRHTRMGGGKKNAWSLLNRTPESQQQCSASAITIEFLEGG